MSPISIGVIGIMVMLILFFLGMPIGFSMALVGFLGLASIVGVTVALSSIVLRFYGTCTVFAYSVLPFFILMAEFARVSGLAYDIYTFADKWLRWLPGGLGVATIGGCAVFASICGSSVATTATMGRVSLPEMKRYHYDNSFAAATVAAAGGLGFLIPPSVVLVIYGIIAEESVGKLLIAGILPGLLLATALIGVSVLRVKLNPKLAPVAPGRVSWKERLSALRGAWGVLAIFLLVMGGMYLGFFTPTEGGAVGATGLCLIAIGRKRLTWPALFSALRETIRLVSMIFIIIISAFIFSDFLAVARIPTAVATFIGELEVSRYAILALMLFLLLVLGCVMESVVMLILTVPVLLPIVTSLGFDPIWFGIVAVLMVEMALVTPPVGLNVYVVAGIARDTPMIAIFRGIVPFLLAMFVVELIIVIFPSIVLTLPGMMR